MTPSLNHKNHHNHINMNEENVNLDEIEQEEAEISEKDAFFKSDYTEISSNWYIFYYLFNFYKISLEL